MHDEPLLTEWRLRTYPRVLFGTACFVWVISVVMGSGSSTISGRLGGDFPAFYGAGRMVLEGSAEQLYDWGAQHDAQAGLHADEDAKFLAFAYPPFVALMYAPLAMLPFRLSYVLHTLLQGACLWGAIQLLCPMSARIRKYRFEAFVMALAFYPMLRAVIGAQNTALTALTLAIVWRGLHDRRDGIAGMGAGMLLFKPQFALPVLGLLLLLRRPAILVAAAVVGAVYYALGAALSGADWPVVWWQQVSVFHTQDQALNAVNSVGILGFCEAVLGPGSEAALFVGAALTLGAVGCAMWVWWHHERHPLSLRMAVMVCAVVIVPPHSMFYDAGVLVLALAALAERHGRSALPALVALTALAVGGAGSQVFGANPLFVVTIAVAVWLARWVVDLQAANEARGAG
jgi:hypothetical protein